MTGRKRVNSDMPNGASKKPRKSNTNADADTAPAAKKGKGKKGKETNDVDASDSDIPAKKRKGKNGQQTSDVDASDSDGDEPAKKKKKAAAKKKENSKSKASTRKKPVETTLNLSNPDATIDERLSLVLDHALRIRQDFDFPKKVKELEDSVVAAEAKTTVMEMELKNLEKLREELEKRLKETEESSAAKLKDAMERVDQAETKIKVAEEKADQAERDLERLLGRLGPAPAAPFGRPGPSPAAPSPLRRRQDENMHQGHYMRRIPARMPLHDRNYSGDYDHPYAQDPDETFYTGNHACYEEDYPMQDSW